MFGKGQVGITGTWMPSECFPLVRLVSCGPSPSFPSISWGLHLLSVFVSPPGCVRQLLQDPAGQAGPSGLALSLSGLCSGQMPVGEPLGPCKVWLSLRFWCPGIFLPLLDAGHSSRHWAVRCTTGTHPFPRVHILVG